MNFNSNNSNNTSNSSNSNNSNEIILTEKERLQEIQNIFKNNKIIYTSDKGNKFEKIDNTLIIQDYNKKYNKWYVPIYMYILSHIGYNGDIFINLVFLYEYYGFKYNSCNNYNKKNLELMLLAIKDLCYLGNCTETNIMNITNLNNINIKENIQLIVDRTTFVNKYYTELEYIDYYKIIAIAKKYNVDCCKLLNFFCYIINHFNKKENKEDQHCYCSYNTINKQLQISNSKIIEYSNILEEAKMIKIKHGNKTTSNSYYRYIEKFDS